MIVRIADFGRFVDQGVAAIEQHGLDERLIGAHLGEHLWHALADKGVQIGPGDMIDRGKIEGGAEIESGHEGAVLEMPAHGPMVLGGQR